MKYVVLAPDHIGEVMRGERTTLPVIDPAPIGSLIAIKRARNRRPTCLVSVTHCEPDPDGHTLTIRVAASEHEPRLLAADSSRGYTNDPRLSLKGEGEAVPQDVQDEITMHAIARDARRRRTASVAAQRDRALQTVLERIDNARAAAAGNYVDIRDDLKAITRMHRMGQPEHVIARELDRIERIAYREAA